MSKKSINSLLCILLLSTVLYVGWVYVSVKNAVSTMIGPVGSDYQVGFLDKNTDMHLKKKG
ncbi:hypothetical protein ACQKP0_10680 [Heyndrickxia sp. NPDC080065]|uniref:hypothetical protein n=1 Tax=Heyndrickxia sp. NPDC080065 TaxID=3390568 RepID=UPI003CFF3275